MRKCVISAALASALKDKSAEVRRSVVRTLGEMGPDAKGAMAALADVCLSTWFDATVGPRHPVLPDACIDVTWDEQTSYQRFHAEHREGGGVHRHIRDLVRSLAGRANCLLLEGTARGATVSVPALPGHPDLALPAARLTELVLVLRSVRITRAHVHHLMGMDVDVDVVSLIRAGPDALELGREASVRKDAQKI